MAEFCDAPAAYPAVHHLTSGLRAAAAQAGDPHAMALWAGTGFKQATEEPAAELTRRLLGDSAAALERAARFVGVQRASMQ